MDIHSEKWVKRSLNKAYLIAEDSKDDSTKVGCLITTQRGTPKSWGFNGFPQGVKDLPERNVRPDKYSYTEHAERNAIYLCDTNLENCVMFCTHHPCSGCARAIIQKRITHLHIDGKHGIHSSWCQSRDYDDFLIAREMLTESGVLVFEWGL